MALSKSFIRNAAMTPLDARLANMAQMVCNANGSPRTGVIGGAGAALVATTGTMNVTVAAAEFATSKGKADGVAIFTNDGTVNVAIGAAPASNSRIDVIWVKHFDDTTGDAAGQFLPLFGVTAGAAAAAPTKPAIPTGALELATLRVYSGTTATNGGSNTLTNTYQMTSSRGGIVPFRTLADLQAWTTATTGQIAAVLSNTAAPVANGVYKRNGTAWTSLAMAVTTYTWTGVGVGDGGIVGAGLSMTKVAAESVNDSFVTAVAGSNFTVKAGLYVVTMLCRLNATSSGRTFAQIIKGATNIVRMSAQVGEDTFGVTGVALVESDGTVLGASFFKTTGGLNNMDGRVTVAKIG